MPRLKTERDAFLYIVFSGEYIEQVTFTKTRCMSNLGGQRPQEISKILKEDWQNFQLFKGNHSNFLTSTFRSRSNEIGDFNVKYNPNNNITTNCKCKYYKITTGNAFIGLFLYVIIFNFLKFGISRVKRILGSHTNEKGMPYGTKRS